MVGQRLLGLGGRVAEAFLGASIVAVVAQGVVLGGGGDP